MRPIDFFDRGASLYPDRACFHDGAQTYSYRSVEEMSHRIATGLVAGGVKKEAKVAVYSPNSVRGFECVLGIMRAGGTWVPVNVRNPIDENIRILNAADCEWLFYHSWFDGDAQRIRDEVPGIRQMVCIDGEGQHAPPFDSWISPFSGPAPYVEQAPESLAAVVGTGGTTGTPKAVMLTHANIETMVSNFVTCMPYGEPPVHLVVAPITHTAGVICLPLMAYGATNIIMALPDLDTILEYIERFRVTTLFLPPTVIYMLLQHPRVRECDYSSLRYFIYGAAPMSLEKLKEAIEVFGPVMAQAYGQTEAPIMCTFLAPEEHLVVGDPEKEKRLRSCGRPTLLTQVEIMDDDGELLDPDETGEIVVRGNLVMQGYYKNPEQTREVSTFGWHHTGDVGYKDRDGYVYIVDRKKEMIISGGFNIYPNEVEQVLLSHPAVQECAVIGVPHEKWGEAVKAVIEVKPGVQVAEEELVSFCRERLGSVKAPKSVEVWPSLPRSSIGKVLKKKIREKFWEGRSRMV